MEVDRASAPERFRYCDLKEAVTSTAPYGCSIADHVDGRTRQSIVDYIPKAESDAKAGLTGGAVAQDKPVSVLLKLVDFSTVCVRFHATATRQAEGGERRRSCTAVRRSSNCIGPPQCGHCHSPSCWIAGCRFASSGPLGGGSAAISCRHNGRSIERRRVLRMPKWRMRTKPRGRTCKRKRRRNSSTGKLIWRFLFLCAESRQRKVTCPSASEVRR